MQVPKKGMKALTTTGSANMPSNQLKWIFRSSLGQRKPLDGTGTVCPGSVQQQGCDWGLCPALPMPPELLHQHSVKLGLTQ